MMIFFFFFLIHFKLRFSPKKNSKIKNRIIIYQNLGLYLSFAILNIILIKIFLFKIFILEFGAIPVMGYRK
jgi:hypothetical protein